MNTVSQTIRPAVYVCIWILLVFGGWFLWLSALHFVIDIGDYSFMIIFGLIIGILSGLSPARVFLACFCGFFIIALLIGFYFSIFGDLVLSGILCGLFAIAGVIARRIIMHQKTKELHLNSWEWGLLLGGTSALADYLTIPGAYMELLVYQRSSIFLKLFIPALIGLFALGLYAGVFYDRERKELMKSVEIFSLGGHSIFFIYLGYLFATGHTSRNSFLFTPLIGIFCIAILLGAHIGCRSKEEEK
jgi:hypothetical protein